MDGGDSTGVALQEFSALSGLPMEAFTEAQLPVLFERTVDALNRCLSIEDSIKFDTLAEGLAIWGKASTEIGIAAKRLKLHAHRRMGELARDMAMERQSGKYKGRSILLSHGVKPGMADDAMYIAKMPAPAFAKVLAEKSPPTPAVLRKHRPLGTDHALIMDRLRQFRSVIRNASPSKTAADLAKAKRVKSLAENASDVDLLVTWLTSFADELRKQREPAALASVRHPRRSGFSASSYVQ